MELAAIIKRLGELEDSDEPSLMTDEQIWGGPKCSER